MESQLDVAGEVTPIVDVAGRTMRAIGQIMQMLDARFGAAATRAEQIPSHHQNTEALRCEEQLYGILRGRVPQSR